MIPARAPEKTSPWKREKKAASLRPALVCACERTLFCARRGVCPRACASASSSRGQKPLGARRDQPTQPPHHPTTQPHNHPAKQPNQPHRPSTQPPQHPTTQPNNTPPPHNPTSPLPTQPAGHPAAQPDNNTTTQPPKHPTTQELGHLRAIKLAGFLKTLELPSVPQSSVFLVAAPLDGLEDQRVTNHFRSQQQPCRFQRPISFYSNNQIAHGHQLSRGRPISWLKSPNVKCSWLGQSERPLRGGLGSWRLLAVADGGLCCWLQPALLVSFESSIFWMVFQLVVFSWGGPLC